MRIGLVCRASSCRLAAEQTTLAGLYQDSPKHATSRPTAERLLAAFKDLTLTTIHLGGQVHRHLTPLPTPAGILALWTSRQTFTIRLPLLKTHLGNKRKVRLSFLVEHTNEDEVTVLTHALGVGMDVLYRQAIEEAYMEGRVDVGLAIDVLGAERVEDIRLCARGTAQGHRTRACGLD